MPPNGLYRVVGLPACDAFELHVRKEIRRVRVAGFRPWYGEDTTDLDTLVLTLRVKDAVARWLLPTFRGHAISSARIREALVDTPIAVTVHWISRDEATFFGANGVSLDAALMRAGYVSSSSGPEAARLRAA